MSLSFLRPSEIEFLAESENVFIRPLFRLDKLQLITGTFGEFRPPNQVLVPLWLAVMLKRSQKCTIVAPSWLDIEYFQARLDDEKEKTSFSEVPFRYTETASILLDVASDDIPNSGKIRSLLQDLRDMRVSKVRAGLELIDGVSPVNLDNLGLMELNEVRPFMVKAMDDLFSIATTNRSDKGDSTFASGSGAVGEEETVPLEQMNDISS